MGRKFKQEAETHEKLSLLFPKQFLPRSKLGQRGSCKGSGGWEMEGRELMGPMFASGCLGGGDDSVGEGVGCGLKMAF